MAIETSDSVTTIRRERLIVVPLFIARRVVAERECRTRWWETLREIYGIGSGPTTVPRSDDGGASRGASGGGAEPAGPSREGLRRRRARGALTTWATCRGRAA